MRKFIIILGILLGMATSASAITYEEVISDLRVTANYKNIETTDTIIQSHVLLGDLIQLNNVNAVVRQNQIGGEQTRYYGNLLFEEMKLLPLDEVMASYIRGQVMLTVYARPTETPQTYDMLILYDSASIGLSCAIQGTISQKTYEMLQNATIAYDGYGNLGLYTKMIGFGAHY